MTGLLLSLMLPLLPQTTTCAGDAELKKLAARSDVVLIAEVKEIEPTSELQPWSGGLISSKQYVRYEIRSVLKGEMRESEVRVGFYLIRNSMTAAVDKSRPQLSPELFKEHNVHIVFLELDRKPSTAEGEPLPSSYTSVDSDCGAIIATPDAEAAISTILSHTR